MTARQVLDRYFLEVRCKLLEIAAVLDRIDRADGAEATADDPKLRGIRQALAVLSDAEPDRAERIQMLFSRDYDAKWTRDLEAMRAKR
jgi:hypothetical protein